MNATLRPLIAGCHLAKPQLMATRSVYYKFKRTKVPPLSTPRESPYIVGPYLKPDYYPVEYLTDPIQPRNDDDFDHYIYEPIEVHPDEDRKVRLLLIADVEGLGVAGQVVDAPYRYGASKLIAMRKAEYFTEFTNKWYKFGPRTMESASTALSPRTARLLRSRVFELPLAKRTQVQPWHISLGLRLAGCLCPVGAVDKDTIEYYFDENDVQHVKCIVVINNHERIEVKFAFAKASEQSEGS